MSGQANNAAGRVIYLSSFSYPTNHAHPLHALLMARAFSALYPERSLFVTAGVKDGSLSGIRYSVPFGALAPVVRALRLRSFAYPLWLAVFLLTHAAWQENLTIFTNDLPLAGRLGWIKGIFSFRLVADIHGAAGTGATRRTLKNADRLVFVTNGLRDSLTHGDGRLLKKSLVLGNAVDAAQFVAGHGEGTRRALGIPTDAFIIGYAGRFKPMDSDKGISFLIESLAHLPDDVHLLLVGGTKEEVAATQREAESHGVVARAHVVERVMVDALANYLAASDVLTYVPPRGDAFLTAETSPMKLFEYQAAGKPIIVSDLPALRDALVLDAGAELVTPGSLDSFVAAVGRIRSSAATYRAKAESARARVRANTWEARVTAALTHAPAPRKSMLRHAFEGIFITATGDLILKGLSAVSTLLILHNLIPYDYGVWRLLLSAMSALGLLGLTGVTGMFTADIARELGEGRAEQARSLLESVTRFLMIAAAVAAIGLVIAAPFISKVSGIGLTQYLYVLAITLFVAGLRQSYQIYFQAYLRPVATQIFKNATTILYLIGIVTFVGIFSFGVWGIVLAYSISISVPAFAYLPTFMGYLRRVNPDVERYNLRRALLGRGKWALGEDYISALTSAAWPWITGYFLSISEVGIISLALLLMSQVSSVIPVQYVLRSLLPRIANDATRVNDWLVRGMRYTLWGHVVVGLGVFAVITVALPIVAPKYVPVIPLFGALTLALPFIGIGIVLVEWFYAHKKQREFFIVNTIPNILFVALLPLLLPLLGISGFLLPYIGSFLLVDLFSLWYLRSYGVGSISLTTLLMPDVKDRILLKRAISSVLQRIRPQSADTVA